MVIERIRETIMAKVGAFVESTLRSLTSGAEREPLYVAEHKAQAFGREMARLLLQGMVDAMGSGHCGQRHIGRDGVERVFKGYVEKTYRTIVGPVTVRCAVYSKKGADPSCVFPLREQLGLGAGQYSPGMEEVIVLAGVGDVYREALRLLERLTGTAVSVRKAETTIARWGAEAKAKVKAELSRPESTVERIAATRPVKGSGMCVTTDAVSVQTTEGWRDAKLMASYAFDAKGEKVGQAAYAGTLHYQEDDGDLVWRLMERTGASQAERLVWLGDGAPWIWNQQAIVAPHAVAIVDFYHAADRLWKAGRALHAGEGAARVAKAWSQKRIRNLYNGKVHAVVKELALHARRLGPPPPGAPEEDPRKVLGDAHRYFVNNASRMDYAKYRAHGYPIGSGVAESACRHVVGIRMKRTAAMTWHEDNAEALLQLRCLCASAEWDRFWGLDALWKAIRARAA
jgi:hypothetical protein